MLELRDSGLSPQALENQPVIYAWMVEYLEGFQVLNSTRQVGMDIQPISLVEIECYLRLYGSSDPARFVEYIRKMDSTYLGVMANKKPVKPASKEPEVNGQQSANVKRERRSTSGDSR